MLKSNSPSNDFVHEPVPEREFRAWWRILSVWTGFIIVVGVMALGGQLAAGLPRGEFTTTVLLGNFILGLLAAFSGFVAARSRKSFAQLCDAVFPGASAKIVQLYVPVTLIAWYAIECAIFGALLGHIFGLNDLMTHVAMAASAALFCITTYLGFRGLQWISLLLVPTIVVLGAYAVAYVIGTGSGEFSFGAPLSFNGGLAIVIGSWALGAVAAYPDLARFAKTPLVGALIGFGGILIFNSLNFFIGGVGAVLSKQSDPALILLAAGSTLLAVVMAVGNIWTTNDANLYSASLGISRAFPIVDRRPAVLISAALSLVIAFFNPAQSSVFFAFVLFLGNTAPALGGVVLGGYLLTKDGQRVGPAIAGWIGWLSGAVVSHVVPGVLTVPAGFIVGFLVWWLVRAITGAQPVQASS